VAHIVRESGYAIVNVDATVICEAPKLAPHIPQMRQNIAAALAIPVEAVSVKATTTEGLGFTGAGEGIAVHAVAMLAAAR
jgi:2-C-methyl-D-erythritol 4-phosphate cytidylyltransferase/2-C-methyl-D-erythritol 2,4-cyclodiphosphate synthase